MFPTPQNSTGQQLIGLGFAISPLPAGAKHVGGTNYPGHTQATNDPAQIAAWEAQFPGCQWAVEATRSRLIIVDVDDKPEEGSPLAVSRAAFDRVAGGHWPETAITARGGQHVYFRLPEGVEVNSQTDIAPGVNVRAYNGYVVAPGGTFEGKPYQWAGNPIATAPEWLVKHCTRSDVLAPLEHTAASGGRMLPPMPGDILARHAILMVKRQCARLAEEFEGGRNNRLNEICNNVLPFYHDQIIDPDEIVSMLTDAALDSGLGMFETQETIKSGLGIDRNYGDLLRRVSTEHPAILLAHTVAGLRSHSYTYPVAPSMPVAPPPKFTFEAGWEDAAPPQGYAHGLTHPGMVTVLSGPPGSGKTSLVGLLAGAAMADQIDAGEPNGRWPINLSSVLLVGYEGMNAITQTLQSLRKNKKWEFAHKDRFHAMPVESQMVFEGNDAQRKLVINQQLVLDIEARIVHMKTTAPGGRVTLVIDNVMQAMDNAAIQTYARTFMEICSVLAVKHNIAALILTHPPKVGGGAFGSYVFSAAADIMLEMDFEDIGDGKRENWLTPLKSRVGGAGTFTKYTTMLSPDPVYNINREGTEGREEYTKLLIDAARIPFIVSGSVERNRPNKEGKGERKGNVTPVETSGGPSPSVIIPPPPTSKAAFSDIWPPPKGALGT